MSVLLISCGIGALVAILGAAALLWRLRRSLFESDRLRRLVEYRLSKAAAPHHLNLGGLALAWPAFTRPVRIDATDVRIEDGEGRLMAVFDLVRLELPISAILRRRTECREVRLLGGTLFFEPFFAADADGAGSRTADLMGKVVALEITDLEVRSSENTSTGLQVNASGVRGSTDRLVIDISATSPPIPLSEFGVLWPSGPAEDVRDWILATIPTGQLKETRLTGLLKFENGRPSFDSLEGSFSFSDLEIDLLRPQPPFRGVFGSARFDRHTLDFHVHEAAMGEIKITEGRVLFEEPWGEDPRASISLECAGEARAAALFASSDPVNFFPAEDIPPEDLAGRIEAEIQVSFRFVDLPDLETSMRARLRNFSLRGLPLGFVLSEGDLDLTLKDHKLVATGPAVVNGVGVDLQFSEKAAETSTHRVLRMVTTEGDGGLSFHLRETEKGVDIEITAKDLGALLHGSKTSSRFVGGSLRLTAVRANSDSALRGEIGIDDIQVLRAPLLARLLAVASLNGLVQALSDDGLFFKTARSRLKIGPDVLEFEDIRISGRSLGLTGEAVVDARSRSIRASGLLAPMAEIQNLVQKIPFVGALLGSTPDSRPVAIKFGVTGPWREPEVRVHPLSLANPDLVRNLKTLLFDPILKN